MSEKEEKPKKKVVVAPPPVHVPVPVVRAEERQIKWLTKAIGDMEAKIVASKTDPDVVVTSRDYRYLAVWNARLVKLKKDLA